MATTEAETVAELVESKVRTTMREAFRATCSAVQAATGFPLLYGSPEA